MKQCLTALSGPVVIDKMLQIELTQQHKDITLHSQARETVIDGPNCVPRLLHRMRCGGDVEMAKEKKQTKETKCYTPPSLAC